MVMAFEMQSIPSLIGAGTAVAAAATGLAFGQLPGEPQDNFYNNSSPTGKPFESDRDLSSSDSFFQGTNSAASTTSSRAPAHSPAQGHIVPPLLPVPVHATSQPRAPRSPSHARIASQKSSFRRSLRKQGENITSAPVAGDSRDSVSSNGSWMRRLSSIRSLSHHGSLRSSSPDSPSLFSFGSSAPIFSTLRDPALPPNKLVKRTPRSSSENVGFFKKRGSRSLRKPATSHQRSATLQHQLTPKDLPPSPNSSIDQKRPRAKSLGVEQKPIPVIVKDERSRWKSFWHSKLSHIGSKATTARSGDDSGQPMRRRVRLEEQPLQQVYLVTPRKLMTDESLPSSNEVHKPEFRSRTTIQASPESSENEPDSTEVTPSKKRKRPMSIQFSLPANWIARAGSIRLSKKAGDTQGDKLHIFAPIADNPVPIQSSQNMDAESIREVAEISRAEADLAAIFHPPGTSCAPPSPHPPLSRLSSFHPDINCLDSSSSSAPADQLNEGIIDSVVPPRIDSQVYHSRTLERASTIGSSEYQRGFTSGDDDDTDSKTDTPFDSFRTVASGRKQGVDSPLESLFDNSLPGTLENNSKPKRLSIQDILGPSFNGGSKIMEEDESAPAIMSGPCEELEARFRAATLKDDDKPASCPTPQDVPRDNDDSRLLSDDDSDDDMGWARDDEMDICNGLSPPGSMNSHRSDPVCQTTSGDVGSEDKHDVRPDSASGRPRSTVFDWSESSVNDRRAKNGLTYRPKTVHGKQELDGRGGRSASRKGPVAAHVRSKSVPLVPDLIETAKSTPKFGTWGLGQKNVSEHWDDDFEFEEDAGPMPGPVGQKIENQSSMRVPASIQATQPTIKAHSGQIRELSLLVNDLKRLCRLGREMGMLVGSSSKLWYEAEGIIALASPDEDAEAADGETVDDFDFASLDEQFNAHGFDGASLEAPKTLQHQNSLSHCQSIFLSDDVFGTCGTTKERLTMDGSGVPEKTAMALHSTSVARSVMESMNKRLTANDADGDDGFDTSPKGQLNFDTNSLKELVKRAGDLRDNLSELVRHADPITQSPGRSPKHTRADGSPAFTRVFDAPTSSPTSHGPHSHKSVLGGTSLNSSPSNKMSRRMQVMTVS